MFKMFKQILLPLRNDKRGVTIIEYALLAALVGIALTATLNGLVTNIGTAFTKIGSSL